MPSVSTERFKARRIAQVSRRPPISTRCGCSLLALRPDRFDHRRNVLGYAMRRLTVLGLGLTAAWVLAIVIVLVFNADDISTMTLNAWGDFLAGVSAPLALLWLVIGYFQHGEELRLNTRALEAQQEELRRQVEETATLAQNAERQAQATEGLVQLNEADREHAAWREVMEAQPIFVEHGGGSSGAEVYTNLLNRGGVALDLELFYDGPNWLEISPTRRLDSNQETKLTLRQVRGQRLDFPVQFALAYTDRLAARRLRRFELSEHHEVRELGEVETLSDSKE